MADYRTLRTTMVDTQIRPSDVTKFPLIDAFLTVPRESFVPAHLRDAAYAGENVDLGEGRVLLDARTLAKMLELLDIVPTDLVLDIGPGLGYSSAILSQLAEAVVAVEENTDFARDAERILAEVDAVNVAVVEGEMTAGAADIGPFDAMIIQGAIEVFPTALADQLKDGGRVVALFLEDRLGVCRLGIKSGDTVSWRHGFNAGAPVLPGFSKSRAFAL